MGYQEDMTVLQALPADNETHSHDQANSQPTDTSDGIDLRSELCLKALSQIVREVRELIGMSQDDLAAEAKLHRTYISDIERGVRNFSVKTLSRIARSLDLSAAHLMHLAEDRVDEWMAAPGEDEKERR